MEISQDISSSSSSNGSCDGGRGPVSVHVGYSAIPTMPASVGARSQESGSSVLVASRATGISGDSATPSYITTPQFGRTALEVVAKFPDIWLLGITIVVGGQYFDWNEGLKAGFGNFMIAAVWTAVGYICLCFSMAEMTSILPFSGGTYGFARVTVNIFGGYIVGCCEAIEYICYVSSSVFVLGKMTTMFLGFSNIFEPFYWFLFYVVAIGIQIQGGLFFWRVNKALAAVSVTVLCLYCIGCIPIMNFTENGRLQDSENPWFGGSSGFSLLNVLPLASWFFVGIEAVPLAGQETHEPKIAMPKGIILSVLTVTVITIAVIFCTVSVGPSAEDLSEALSPLSFGFSKVFNMPERMAYLLIAPAMFSTAYGFLFACGRQTWAMAESGLFPSVLRITVPSRGTPYVALVVTSLISYIFLLTTWFYPWFEKVIFNACILGSYVSYLASFFSFISFRLFFPGLDKKYTYRSPLGLVGAVLGILIFLICIVAVSFFQNDNGLSIFFFLAFMAVMSLYYFFSARASQRFSPMEKSVMMIAHVLKADRTKKKVRPGRLPDKDEAEHWTSQLQLIFRNRWRRDASTDDRRASSALRRESSIILNNSVALIQVANISVNESEPFYDKDRVVERIEGLSRGSLWASLKDALSAIPTHNAGVSAPAVTPCESRASFLSPSQSGHNIDVGLEMVYPAHMSRDNSVELSVSSPGRDNGGGLQIFSSVRESLGIAIGLPQAVPSCSRLMTPVSSICVVEEGDIALTLPTATNSDDVQTIFGGIPPRTLNSTKSYGIFDSIRDAFTGNNTTQTKHYVTPNLSRETSEVDVNILPSPPGSADIFRQKVDHISKPEALPADSGIGSYNNSARISICSVEDDQLDDTKPHLCYLGEEGIPRNHFGFHILTNLMAIAAGGPGATLGGVNNEGSGQSSKCPSAGSGQHQGPGPTCMPNGVRTPLSDNSDNDIRRTGLKGASMTMWTALRESLGKALTNTSRQSYGPSLETSGHSSKYTSVHDEDIGDPSRILVKTEPLDYSEEQPDQRTDADVV